MKERIERLEAQIDEAYEELKATRAELQRYRRESGLLENRLDVALGQAAWYRSKLLQFVNVKWIKQEKAKDGVG